MIAFDSNILVYAHQVGDGNRRHERALELVANAAIAGAIIPIQVLGEFLNVCRKKLGVAPQVAVDQVRDYRAAFNCPATAVNDLADAAFLADRFKLQFFDALIASIAERSGATMLLSEDMHDGLQIESLRVLNPFNPANQAEIATLLA